MGKTTDHHVTVINIFRGYSSVNGNPSYKLETREFVKPLHTAVDSQVAHMFDSREYPEGRKGVATVNHKGRVIGFRWDDEQ